MRSTLLMAAPMRTCVVCRSRRPKNELLRLAATPRGVRFDPDMRLPGRGAYLCPDPDCVHPTSRRGVSAVRRALRRGDDDEVTKALAAGGTHVAETTTTSQIRSDSA